MDKQSIKNKNLLKYLAKEASLGLKCDITGICTYGAELIAKKFIENNFSDFIVVEGYIKVPGWTGRTSHSWVILSDNTIIDPAFEQFPKGTKRLDSIFKKYTSKEYMRIIKENKNPVNDIQKYINAITNPLKEFFMNIYEATPAPTPPKKDSKDSAPSDDKSTENVPGADSGSPFDASPDGGGNPFDESPGGSVGGGLGGDMGGEPGSSSDTGKDEKTKISNYSEKLKSSKIIKFQKMEKEPGYKFESNDEFYTKNYVGKTSVGSILLPIPDMQDVNDKNIERNKEFIKKYIIPKIDKVSKMGLSQRKRIVLIGNKGMPYVHKKYAKDESGIIAKHLNDTYKNGYTIFDTWCPQEYYSFISNDALWQQIKERTSAENIEIKASVYLYLLTTLSGRLFANKLKTEKVMDTIKKWGLYENDVNTLNTQGLNKISAIVYPELYNSPETLTSFIIKMYLQLLRVNMIKKIIKYENEGKVVIVLADINTAWSLKPSFDKIDELKKGETPAEKNPDAENAPQGISKEPASEKTAEEPPTEVPEVPSKKTAPGGKK